MLTRLGRKSSGCSMVNVSFIFLRSITLSVWSLEQVTRVLWRVNLMACICSLCKLGTVYTGLFCESDHTIRDPFLWPVIKFESLVLTSMQFAYEVHPSVFS